MLGGVVWADTASGEAVSVLDEARVAELLRPQLEVEPYLRLSLRCPVCIPMLGPSASKYPRSARARSGVGNGLRDFTGETVEAECVALDRKRAFCDVLPDREE